MNSGPPPDPNALRRDRKQDKDGWTTLPQRTVAEAPSWPLATLDLGAEDGQIIAATERAERELDLWRDLWTTPQATAWRRLGWTHEVAMYVRLLVGAERSGETKALAEARMWSDRLGLNPAAMLRNRWRVADDEVAARREPRAATAKRADSMRDRLQAVNDGGA